MARTKGALGPEMRAALEMARQHGDDFSIAEFQEWLEAAGGKGSAANLNGYLRRLLAPDGERPSAESPLIMTRAGRQGPGGAGLYKYAFSGSAGAPVKTQQTKDKIDALKQNRASMGYDEFDDEDGTDPGSEDKAPAYMPTPNIEGDYAAISMQKLADAGIGPTDPFWEDVANTKDEIDLDDLMTKRLPPQLRRAAVAVAKHIFKNQNQSFGGAPVEKEPSKSGSDRKLGQSWRKDGQKQGRNPFMPLDPKSKLARSTDDDDKEPPDEDEFDIDDDWEEAEDDGAQPAAEPDTDHTDEPTGDDFDSEEPTAADAPMFQPEPQAPAPRPKVQFPGMGKKKNDDDEPKKKWNPWSKIKK